MTYWKGIDIKMRNEKSQTENMEEGDNLETTLKLTNDLQNNVDQIIEALWEQFLNVPINKKTECTEDTFLHFPTGTFQEEIWQWFDSVHSKGVMYLMEITEV